MVVNDCLWDRLPMYQVQLKQAIKSSRIHKGTAIK